MPFATLEADGEKMPCDHDRNDPRDRDRQVTKPPGASPNIFARSTPDDSKLGARKGTQQRLTKRKVPGIAMTDGSLHEVLLRKKRCTAISPP